MKLWFLFIFSQCSKSNRISKESIRLVRDVQYFDVLRSDRTTAGAGLEIRVPFFDKDFEILYAVLIQLRK